MKTAHKMKFHDDIVFSCICLIVFVIIYPTYIYGADENRGSVELDLPIGTTPWRMSISDNKVAISYSNDVVSLIDAKTLNQLLKIRLPPRESDKLRARGVKLDVSKDVIAVSAPRGDYGKSSAVIYFYSATTGERIAPFSLEVPEIAESIEFTPKGNLMILGLQNSRGVEVWEWKKKKKLWSSYGDIETRGDTPALAVSNTGKFFVAGGDHGIVVTNLGEEINATQMVDIADLKIGKIESIALSPDEKYLVIGSKEEFKTNGKIVIYNIETKEIREIKIELPAFKLHNKKWTNLISRVVWLKNWNIIASGRVWIPVSKPTARSYHYDGVEWTSGFLKLNPKTGTTSYYGMRGSETIFDMKPHDNGVFYLTADPYLAAYDTNGRILRSKYNKEVIIENKKFDFRTIRDDLRHFAINTAGSVVSIEALNRGAGFSFDLTKLKISRMLGPGYKGLYEPKHDPNRIQNWHNTSQSIRSKVLLIDNVPVEPQSKSPDRVKQERSRNYVLYKNINGEDRMLWGTSEYLQILNLEGIAVGPTKKIKSSPLRINVTNNGKIAVIAHLDGTVRWYAIEENLELLLSLYVDKEFNWISWTPTGYYSTNYGTKDIVALRPISERNTVVEIELERFKKKFNRPDVISSILSDYKVNTEVSADIRSDYLDDHVQILSVKKSNTNTRSIEVEYLLKSVNNIKEEVNVGIVVKDKCDVLLQKQKWTDIVGVKRAIIELPKKCNMRSISPKIVIGILNNSNDIRSGTDDFVLLENHSNEAYKKRKLYALVIGNDYKDESKWGNKKLNYAVKDAKEFSKFFCEQKLKAWGEVRILALGLNDTDINTFKNCNVNWQYGQSVSRTNIERGLLWLREKSKDLSHEDYIMIFIAGHGHQDDGVYYFWTENTDPNEPILNSISDFDIAKFLHARNPDRHYDNIPKIYMFIDTCRVNNEDGGIDFNAYNEATRIFENIPAYFFFATQSGSVAREDSTLGGGHGVFTYFLLNALKGDAVNIIGSPGVVKAQELKHYIERKVFEHSNKNRWYPPQKAIAFPPRFRNPEDTLAIMDD